MQTIGLPEFEKQEPKKNHEKFNTDNFSHLFISQYWGYKKWNFFIKYANDLIKYYGAQDILIFY